MATATLDWSQCPAVESVPGRVSGAWVLRDTRMPVSVIFENLEYGATLEEIIENYRVTREQIQAVLQFAAPQRAPAGVAAGNLSDAVFVEESATSGLAHHVSRPIQEQALELMTADVNDSPVPKTVGSWPRNSPASAKSRLLPANMAKVIDHDVVE